MVRRSGLGRGLGALIPSAEQDPGATEEVIDLRTRIFREVPVDAITANTFQPRRTFAQDELDSLSASIGEVGVLQPLLVRESGTDSYELIAGERRLRASRQAGLVNVPVIVKEINDEQSLEQALVENLHRKDLNPLDEASAYQQLIDDFGMTHDQIGKRVGRSRTAITNLLRLLHLPAKVQGLVSEERLGEGHARALASVPDEAYMTQLAERAVRENLTVRSLEDAIRTRKEAEAGAKSSSTSSTVKSSPSSETRVEASVLEWRERLAELLDTRVTVETSARRGKITIEFADLADLDRLGLVITGSQGPEA